MKALSDYESDQIIDTLRELRHVLETNDLLDSYLADEINQSLETLGVADATEN